MSLHSSMSFTAQQKRIDRDQTGATTEQTLPEQIEFLDREIAKNESWIEYYQFSKRVRLSKEQRAVHIASFTGTVERQKMSREILLAKLYASQMPDIGGSFELAKAVTK